MTDAAISEPLRPLAVPLASLHMDPSNARRHPERNMEAIKASLAKFGQRKPIVVQREGMIVRAGNGTLAAAKALGWETIAAVVLDDDNATAMQYAIADNRTGELAEWDDETLATLLDGMDADTRDVLAFDEKEVRKLMQALAPEVEEDKVPDVPSEPVTKRGDRIVLGRHVLMCGDSTDEGDVARCLAGAEPSLCLTDPPYGCNFRLASWREDANHNAELVEMAFRNAPSARVWTPGKMNLLRELTRDPKAKVLAWTKGFSPAGSGLGGASVWEPVLVLDPPRKELKTDHLDHRTYQDADVVGKHPDPKPLSLWVELMGAFCGDTVYDPFLGSGTTLIVAEQLDRTCYGIEIDPAYCDVIVQRWENLTGEKAVRP